MILDKAADYHLQTVYERLSMGEGDLDWGAKPEPYKTYPDADLKGLPRELSLPKVESAQALLGQAVRTGQPLDMVGLANLLFMANGFTSQVDYGREVFLYRSAPSAGALYPVEIYLSAVGIEGLEDGLYHYSIMDFALTRLRSGPPPEGCPGPALILTGLYFRSAWKYRNRAYRYCLLDSGHVAENLMLVAPTLGFKVEFLADFDDRSINDYLGLTEGLEAALAIVTLDGAAGAPAGTGEMNGRVRSANPVSKGEPVFELIEAVARLTSVPLNHQPNLLDSRAGEDSPLPKVFWEGFQCPSLVQVLRQRRSRRNFKPETLPLREVARLLDMSMTTDVGRVINVGLVSNEVEDLADGFHWICPETRALRRHRPGFIGPPLSQAALNQDWVGRANVILVVTSPMKKLESDLGPRSLRLAYLAAGRLGQKVYLGAEAMGWGCCGVGAFFDADVARILDLGEDEWPLYILPVGPIRKRTRGGRPTEG
jgi:SagB-type dehydrogenase family enzyme